MVTSQQLQKDVPGLSVIVGSKQYGTSEAPGLQSKPENYYIFSDRAALALTEWFEEHS